MEAHPLIDIIAIGLVLAFVFGMVAQRFHISPLVGYLIAGIIIGPNTPGFVANAQVAAELAEIGVILLMFGVGLHFSIKDLLAVKNISVPGAVAQISVATVLGWILAMSMGWSMTSGIVFGLCLSTASTVVLLRALEERQLIDTTRGKIAIGWLIVEDLAMVLTLVLLPAIIGIVDNNGAASFTAVATDLAITLGKVIAFIAIMLVVGTKIVPWILTKSATTGSREIFTLAVLALAMGIAFGAVKIFGVSFALGAFFAGMVLNESELSHRAADDTLPLRDAFSVLFFVSVGMLFDPSILVIHPIALVATIAIIIFGKSVAAYVLVRAMKHTKRTALLISASLAQIGEFAFILATLGGKIGVITPEMHSLVVAGAIISILLNPLTFNLVEKYLSRTETVEDVQTEEEEKRVTQVPVEFCNHAILIGYGRVGTIIAEELVAKEVPLVVVDSSLQRIDTLRERQIAAVYGNAAKHEILDLARLDCARWLLVTTANGYEAGEIITYAREKRPDLEIIVRAHYDDEVDYILEHGADQVVMGEREIAASMLGLLNTKPGQVPVPEGCPI